MAMKLVKTASVFSGRGIWQMLLVAVLYGLLTYWVKASLEIVTGLELRLSTFIPVVGGIVFGLPGACGAAVGNFFASYYAGQDAIASLLGSIGNFFLAYFPYRVWYGYDPKKAGFYIYNNRTFCKFLNLAFFNAMMFAIMMHALFSIYYERTLFSELFVLFSNNYIPVALVGTPLLLFYSRTVKTKYVSFAPEPIEITKVNKNYDFGLRAMILFGAVYTLAIALNLFNGFFFYVSAAVAAGLYLYVCLQPSCYVPADIESTDFRPLSISLLLRMLMTAVSVICILTLISVKHNFISIDQWRSVDTWVSFYYLLLLNVLLFGFGMYNMLQHFEQNFTERIKFISRWAHSYIADGKLNSDNGALPEIKSTTNPDEIDRLVMKLQDMQKNIENSERHLQAALTEQEIADGQMEVARKIQDGALPDLSKLQLEGYSVSYATERSKSLSGAMYNCFTIDDDHLLLMVANADKSGVPTALYIVSAQALVEQNAGLLEPAKIAEATNNALCLLRSEGIFLTMWLGVAELSGGRVKYVNVGQAPALIVDKDNNSIWQENNSGTMLGFMEGAKYKEFEYSLSPGDKLLVYTGGITKTRNGQNEVFGVIELEKSFKQNFSPDDVIMAVKKHMGNDMAADNDMTCLCLQREIGGEDKC